MKSLSLYEDKQSFLNGLTPGCKAFYIIAALVIPAMLGNKLISIGCICIPVPVDSADDRAYVYNHRCAEKPWYGN